MINVFYHDKLLLVLLPLKHADNRAKVENDTNWQMYFAQELHVSPYTMSYEYCMEKKDMSLWWLLEANEPYNVFIWND